VRRIILRHLSFQGFNLVQEVRVSVLLVVEDFQVVLMKLAAEPLLRLQNRVEDVEEQTYLDLQVFSSLDISCVCLVILNS